MPSIGPLELIIVLVIILVIFGPKRLPQAGRSLGQGLREFKDSVTGKDKDKDSGTVQASSELPPAAAPAPRAPPPPPPSRAPRNPQPPPAATPRRPSAATTNAGSHGWPAPSGPSAMRTTCRSSSISTSCARGSSSAPSAF